MDKVEKMFCEVANDLANAGKLNGLTEEQKRIMIQFVTAARMIGESL